MKCIWLCVFALLVSAPVCSADSRSIALMFDISKSIPANEFEKAKQAVLGLMEQAPPTDNIAVYAFGDQMRRISVEELRSLHPTDSYTLLYDGAYDVAQALADERADRKAIVIISDGYDTRSATILEDTVAYANQQGIAIYGVGAGKVNRKTMERIAKLTDGRYFPVAESNWTSSLDAAITAQKKASGPVKEPAPPPTVAPAPVAAPGSKPVSPLQAPATEPGRRGFPLLWIALGIGAVVVLGLILFFVLRPSRAAERLCPTCGRALEPYQTICTACAGAPTRVAPVPPKPAGDSTQEIAASMEAQSSELIPVELLEKKPVTEESLTRTFVLMETPMLVVRNGRNIGEAFSLNRVYPVSIGRSRVNEILLDDVTVSGQHCRIIPENGKHVLYDLSSTNGTFLNDKKVTRAVLKEGDIIRVGETQFLFKVEQHRN